MMKGFFQDIPMELEEAAQVDGCSRLHTFLRICLPLVAPGLATTSIMVLLNSWNEFMFALILSGRATRTLPVGISAFLGSVSIDWGSSSAAATLATLPILLRASSSRSTLFAVLLEAPLKDKLTAITISNSL